MGSKTIPRSPAFPPVFTRYKPLELSGKHLDETADAMIEATPSTPNFSTLP